MPDRRRVLTPNALAILNDQQKLTFIVVNNRNSNGYLYHVKFYIFIYMRLFLLLQVYNGSVRFVL